MKPLSLGTGLVSPRGGTGVSALLGHGAPRRGFSPVGEYTFRVPRVSDRHGQHLLRFYRILFLFEDLSSRGRTQSGRADRRLRRVLSARESARGPVLGKEAPCGGASW